MERVYVDSNVFFYAKIGDRVYGTACSEVISRISSGSIAASISVLIPLEVSNSLMRFGLVKESSKEAIAIMSLGMEVLPMEASDIVEAAEVSGETGLSPYDCTHAVLMRRYGVKDILSADKDFDKLGWVNRVDPRRFPVA